MSARITLARNAIATEEAFLVVEDDRLMETLEALAMLSEQRLARGSTPLDVANVETGVE